MSITVQADDEFIPGFQSCMMSKQRMKSFLILKVNQSCLFLLVDLPAASKDITEQAEVTARVRVKVNIQASQEINVKFAESLELQT